MPCNFILNIVKTSLFYIRRFNHNKLYVVYVNETQLNAFGLFRMGVASSPLVNLFQYLSLPSPLKPFCQLSPCGKTDTGSVGGKKFTKFTSINIVTKDLINMIFSCRYVKTSELEKEARALLQEARSKPATAGLLVPDPGDENRRWGDKKQINKKSIVAACLTRQINARLSTRDQQTLYSVLFYNRKDELVYPAEFRREDLIICKVPLLDLLKVDSVDQEAGWKYPSVDELTMFQNNRGLDINSLKPIDKETEVPVREITVGRSTDTEIAEIRAWFWECYRREQDSYGSSVVSVDVEEITVSLKDKDAALAAFGSSEPIITTPPKDNFYQWPVKILIGSGLSYLLVVSWPAEFIKYGCYKIWPCKPQEKLIDLLNSLPNPTGVGVNRDRKGLNTHFSEFSPSYPLRLMPGIELGSLAAMNGWRLKATSMPALSFGVLGGLMDKISSRADGKWCLPWDQLPREFKVYALGDAQFGHMCYVVLSAVLIRNIFPDPESICFLMGKSQVSVVTMFNKYVRDSLVNTELYYHPSSNPTTRVELLDCIRERDSNNKLTPSAPDRMKWWSNMIGNWPALTDGGARFLHPVRLFAATQCLVLQKNCQLQTVYRWNEDEDLLTRASDYLSFQQPPTEPHPEDISNQPGLSAHSNLQKETVSFCPQTMLSGDMIGLGRAQKRSWRYILLEWARLNPAQISSVLKRFEKVGDIRNEFWLQHASLYEQLRLMHQRLFDKEALVVEWVQEEIDTKYRNLCKDEEKRLAAAKAEVDRREARVYFLGCLRNLPTVPKTARDELIPKELSKAAVQLKFPPIVRERTTNVPFPDMLPRGGGMSSSLSKPSHQTTPMEQAGVGSGQRVRIAPTCKRRFQSTFDPDTSVDDSDDEVPVSKRHRMFSDVFSEEIEVTADGDGRTICVTSRRQVSEALQADLPESDDDSRSEANSPPRIVKIRPAETGDVTEVDPVVSRCAESSSVGSVSVEQVRLRPAGTEGDPLYESDSEPDVLDIMDDSITSHSYWDVNFE